MSFNQIAESDPTATDGVATVQVSPLDGHQIGVDTPTLHQLLVSAAGYTAGTFTITGFAAGSLIEEVIFDTDGVTPLVLNIAAGSYFTKVIGPVAYDKVIFTAASMVGSSATWTASVFSGNI